MCGAPNNGVTELMVCAKNGLFFVEMKEQGRGRNFTWKLSERSYFNDRIVSGAYEYEGKIIVCVRGMTDLQVIERESDSIGIIPNPSGDKIYFAMLPVPTAPHLLLIKDRTFISVVDFHTNKSIKLFESPL